LLDFLKITTANLIFSSFTDCFNLPRLDVGASGGRLPFNYIIIIITTAILLTPWSRVLLEKLTGLQLVKKFPAFYGTRRLIIPVGARFFTPVQTGSGAHPATFTMGTGPFPG
jgi:hypothetical protein